VLNSRLLTNEFHLPAVEWNYCKVRFVNVVAITCTEQVALSPFRVGGTGNLGHGLRLMDSYTHTHTHLFNGPFSGTTQVSRYQKGITNLDFTEARDSEWQ